MIIRLWDRGDRDAAETAARKVLEIRRETGDIVGQAWVLLVLAQFQLDESAGDSTLETYRQALALDDQAGQRAHRFHVLVKYSEALRVRGDLDGGRDVCAQAKAEADASTDPANQIESEQQCGAIALDRGDLAAFTAAMKRTLDLAREHNDAETPAYVNVLLAHVDVANHDYSAAITRLQPAIQYFADGEIFGSEAEAQSLVAICHAALGDAKGRDSAAARARELRSAITIRGSAAVVDRLLAQLQAVSGDRKSAAARLRELADDAHHRQWVALELEARLAEMLSLAADDPSSTDLRRRVETDARQHGFGWVLSRLAAAPSR
jgi:hypothetical protein